MLNRIATNRLSWVLMLASWLGGWAGAWHHHEAINIALAWNPAVAGRDCGDHGRPPGPDQARHCAICTSTAHRCATLPFPNSAISALGTVGYALPDESAPLLFRSRFSPDQRGPPAA